MKQYSRNGQTYRLANDLTPFQFDMQVHLTDWRWRHLKTRDCGLCKGLPYDVILPANLKDEQQPIYRPIVERVREHQCRFPFKLHKFVGHMASSQVACINLFVPLLGKPDIAAQVLRTVKPDLKVIATDHLDGGFQIEYWPGCMPCPSGHYGKRPDRFLSILCEGRSCRGKLDADYLSGKQA